MIKCYKTGFKILMLITSMPLRAKKLLTEWNRQLKIVTPQILSILIKYLDKKILFR